MVLGSNTKGSVSVRVKMLCVFCCRDKKEVLPMAVKQSNGLVQALVCIECGIAEGIYCASCGYPKASLADQWDKEGRPLVTVCLYCLEAAVEERKGEATAIYSRLTAALGEVGETELAEEATHQHLYADEDLKISILRLIITRAMLRKMEPEDLVLELCGQDPLQASA